MQVFEPVRKLSVWIAIITILFFLVNLFVWDSETVFPHGTVRTVLFIGFIASLLATVLSIAKSAISWKMLVFALVLTVCTSGLYYFARSMNDAWESRNEALKK